MPVRGLFFDFSAWRYDGDMSLCRGAIVRFCVVLRALARGCLGWCRVVANVNNETLSSYRLSETKEIRTLVHYHLATLKKFSPCCLVTMKNFSLS